MNTSQNTTFLNGTSTEVRSALWYTNAYNITMIVLYALIIVAAIVGNILVCTAACFNNNLRKNVASYFIVSLALSDIGTASLSMPFDLESFVTFGRWNHGEALCVIWTTAYLITVPTSMWNLFALSLTRYKKLKNPWDRFRASPFMTSKRAIMAILSSWIYCLTLALVPIMGYKHHYVINDRCFFNIDPIYAQVISGLNFYLPMFAMCFIYHKIYKIARTQYLMPTGLEAKPNPSVQKEQEEHSHKDRSSTPTVNSENSQENCLCCNQGLVLDNDKQRTRICVEDHVKNSISHRENDGLDPTDRNIETKAFHSCSGKFNTEESEADNLENMKTNMNIHDKREGEFTNELSFDRQSCSIGQNINRLYEVDINQDCYLARQAGSKPDKNAERKFVSMVDSVAPSKLRSESPELACGVIIPSTLSDPCYNDQNHITVCAMDDCTSDVSTHVTTQDTRPAVSQGQSKCGELLHTGTPQSVLHKGRNSASAMTQDNICASGKRRKQFVKNKKAARTIAIIVGAFLICWMPYTTLSVITNICRKECFNMFLFYASQVLLLLGYLNSAINPIIFSYQDEQFLKSYRKIIKKLFPCVRNTTAPN